MEVGNAQINSDIGANSTIKSLDYERIKCYGKSRTICHKGRRRLKADEISIFLQSVENVKHMICSLGSSGCNT